MKAKISDRGIVFLISALLVLVSLAVAGWLVVSGQVLSLDGIFLALSCLVLAFGFSLYVGFLVKQAMKELQAGSEPAKVKAPAAAPPKAAAAPAQKTVEAKSTGPAPAAKDVAPS